METKKQRQIEKQIIIDRNPVQSAKLVNAFFQSQFQLRYVAYFSKVQTIDQDPLMSQWRESPNSSVSCQMESHLDSIEFKA